MKLNKSCLLSTTVTILTICFALSLFSCRHHRETIKVSTNDMVFILSDDFRFRDVLVYDYDSGEQLHYVGSFTYSTNVHSLNKSFLHENRSRRLSFNVISSKVDDSNDTYDFVFNHYDLQPNTDTLEFLSELLFP